MVGHYWDALAVFQANNPGSDEARFQAEVCGSTLVSRARKYLEVGFEGIAWIPWEPTGYQYAGAPWFWLRSEQLLGPFDWDSIMLYPSMGVITRKDNGATWNRNLVPSAGDVVAVKSMYPDLPDIPGI